MEYLAGGSCLDLVSDRGLTRQLNSSANVSIIEGLHCVIPEIRLDDGLAHGLQSRLARNVLDGNHRTDLGKQIHLALEFLTRSRGASIYFCAALVSHLRWRSLGFPLAHSTSTTSFFSHHCFHEGSRISGRFWRNRPDFICVQMCRVCLVDTSGHVHLVHLSVVIRFIYHRSISLLLQFYLPYF